MSRAARIGRIERPFSVSWPSPSDTISRRTPHRCGRALSASSERLAGFLTSEDIMSGRYYEELNVGDVFRHATTRTITEMDNVLFSSLTMNPQPAHIDEEYAKTTIYGTRIVNSCFTLGL